MPPLKPDKDKNFGGSLVLDFRQRRRHAKTIYSVWVSHNVSILYMLAL